MEIGYIVKLDNSTDNKLYEVVETTQDRECNTMYVIADYETGEYLEDVFYPIQLEEVKELWQLQKQNY